MFVGLNIQSDALTDSVRTCIDDEIVIYIQKEPTCNLNTTNKKILFVFVFIF